MIKEYVDNFPLPMSYLLFLARAKWLKTDGDVREFNESVEDEILERIEDFDEDVLIYHGGSRTFTTESDRVEIYSLCHQMSKKLRTDGKIPDWMKEIVIKLYFLHGYYGAMRELFGEIRIGEVR